VNKISGVSAPTTADIIKIDIEPYTGAGAHQHSSPPQCNQRQLTL
jgi:hypothetical protein